MRIETNETLLIMSEIKDKPYIMETDFFGREWSEARILSELQGSDAVRVFKLNLHTLDTSDVTEECADLWLKDKDAKAEEIDQDNLPVFVRDSVAWATWELTTPAPRSRLYSTLDARTQGLVHGARFGR